MNADGTHIRRLTHDNGNDLAPAWSPDGLRIAYFSDSPSYGIYVTSASGSPSVTLLATEATTLSISWSPDGSQLAYAGQSGLQPEPAFGQPYALHIVNADGTDDAQVLSNSQTADPAWRPER
jgi:Tol biopolymer transport system component